MTSSMMTGERRSRWAAARRGGMTVLGKVSVPKPINLPSQKLENHGLDPNVEIVPKGSVSWGSRSSSSSSNPWGSSTLSPKADGSTGSPSHLSGRPSSGGTGTRPSTGSSDRAHDPIASAWSSNSRPSSASGVLTSNQTSATSLRPRSAETRPGSSQLSRFAEPLSENSGAWGTAGTAEKLGVTSSKSDGFSLASGDFPALGLEKDNAGKNMESQDLGSQGRTSSSGGLAPVKDRIGIFVAGEVSVNANVKCEAANIWRRDDNPYCEDGVRGKWQADPQGPHPYPNAGIPHQHYEAWHGPPINNHPGGLWYRRPPGGPPGPPFGSPVPPGGFPMEPFHFYHPQIPATALGNPQQVPPPGAGPRAHHPKNGDMYRPPMPDTYMHPGMPMRPGFYPGPVAYEGYYGPPMGYHNSNERDLPFMASGPHSYNRYSGRSAHDAGNSHSRSSGYGPNGKALASDLVEPGYSRDAQGPYRVLLKHQYGLEEKDKEQKWEETGMAKASHVEKGDQQKWSSWENDWREDYKKDEQMGLKRKGFGEEASYQLSDHKGASSSVPVKVESSEHMRNSKVEDDLSVKKVEHSATAFPEIPIAPKDSNLIQKIEGLNAKARASDGRHVLIMSVSSREEQKNTLQIISDSDEANKGSVHEGKNYATGTNNTAAYRGSVAAGDKSFESTAARGPVISRRSTHGMHSRTDHRGQGRFSSQEVDGWRRKSPVSESSTDLSTAHSESSNIPIQDHPAKEITEKSEFFPQGNDGGEFVPATVEPSDTQAQHAKMGELAKQRVKQCQEEEEERARDQKAKAFAKLEELNRRTQAAEGSTQKSGAVPDGAIQNNQEEFQSMAVSTIVASKSGTSGSTLVSNSNDAAQISKSGTIGVENSTVLSNENLLERPRELKTVRMHKHNESVHVKQDVNDSDVVHHSNAPQMYDEGASKQKHLSYKQNQKIPFEKNSSEKIATSPTEPLKGHTDLIVNAVSSCEVIANQISPSCESSPLVPNVMAESSVQQRRRNNRGGKKHKVEEASSGATLSSMISSETNILNNTSAESGKTKASEYEVDASTVQRTADFKDGTSSELRLSSPSEGKHVRANNQWKSQHSRSMARSAQTNKSAEKFHINEAVFWAPVRTQNIAEVSDETIHKSAVEASSLKSDNQLQNNSRNKRAEMERYIPKPVAKEMAQQGSCQQPPEAPSIDKTLSDEIDVKADSGSQGVEGSPRAEFASGKKVVVMESKDGDHSQNIQKKVHGSWHQRASSESTVVLGLQDVQPSNASRNVKKLLEHQRTQKPEVSSVKEQPKYCDEWSSDGWTMPENPESALPLNVPVVKDQGVAARGKRHQFKGHKGTGNNRDRDHDHKKTINGDGGKIYMHSSVPVPETSQTDFSSSSKENRATGDRSTSHWQPKPQTYVTSNQQRSRPNSGPKFEAELGRSNKKDSSPQGGLPRPPQPGKETSEGVAQPHLGQSASLISKVEAASTFGHQESKRDRKIASAKGRPDPPHQGPGSLVENAPPSNIRNEHCMPTGFRRNGSQNSRFNRGYESRGDWSSSGQDNKQHNQPINRERQRHNVHYEYQRVGPYNYNSANNFEGPKDAPPNNGGGKYRERVQSHSRHGVRLSGTVRADGYD